MAEPTHHHEQIDDGEIVHCTQVETISALGVSMKGINDTLAVIQYEVKSIRDLIDGNNITVTLLNKDGVKVTMRLVDVLQTVQDRPSTTVKNAATSFNRIVEVARGLWWILAVTGLIGFGVNYFTQFPK